jgi:hypothetical protein
MMAVNPALLLLVSLLFAIAVASDSTGFVFVVPTVVKTEFCVFNSTVDVLTTDSRCCDGEAQNDTAAVETAVTYTQAVKPSDSLEETPMVFKFEYRKPSRPDWSFRKDVAAQERIDALAAELGCNHRVQFGFEEFCAKRGYPVRYLTSKGPYGNHCNTTELMLWIDEALLACTPSRHARVK